MKEHIGSFSDKGVAMGILLETSLLSFEVTPFCNLMKEHKECPVNFRTYNNTEYSLNENSIVETIKEAINLGFTGLVSFHYYNEPLLEKDLIIRVMKLVPEARYMIWTNGLLLDRRVDNNEFLRKFAKVNITCYDPKDMPFFKDLDVYYGNIEIFDWELDDRMFIYDKEIINVLSCKRPLFEVPIDYHGNIRLCCMDWKNEYHIGNIFIDGFSNIMQSDSYANLLSMCRKRMWNDKCPEICKNCDKVWVSYPKY